MLKGLNRRIVIMKDTGSDYFEQAFFLIKENALRSRKSAIEEAKKVIRELELSNKKKRISPFISYVIFFCLGIALGFFIANIP